MALANPDTTASPFITPTFCSLYRGSSLLCRYRDTIYSIEYRVQTNLATTDLPWKKGTKKCMEPMISALQDTSVPVSYGVSREAKTVPSIRNSAVLAMGSPSLRIHDQLPTSPMISSLPCTEDYGSDYTVCRVDDVDLCPSLGSMYSIVGVTKNG